MKMKGILIAFIEMYKHGREDRLEKSRLRTALNDKVQQNEELIGDVIEQRRRAELFRGQIEDLRKQQVALDREMLELQQLSNSREETIKLYIPEMNKQIQQIAELRAQVAGLTDTVTRQKAALAMQKKLITEYRNIGKKTRR